MPIILHGLIMGIYLTVIVGIITKLFNMWYKFLNNKKLNKK